MKQFTFKTNIMSAENFNRLKQNNYRRYSAVNRCSIGFLPIDSHRPRNGINGNRKSGGGIIQEGRGDNFQY